MDFSSSVLRVAFLSFQGSFESVLVREMARYNDTKRPSTESKQTCSSFFLGFHSIVTDGHTLPMSFLLHCGGSITRITTYLRPGRLERGVVESAAAGTKKVKTHF
jgi:hypothetical protein